MELPSVLILKSRLAKFPPVELLDSLILSENE